MENLVELSSTEQFKTWIETVLSVDNPEATGFHTGEDLGIILRQMAESKPFKQYLYSGYLAFLIQMGEAISTIKDSDEQDTRIQMLHSERVTAGFMMGLKYATYLLEQQELRKMLAGFENEDVE